MIFLCLFLVATAGCYTHTPVSLLRQEADRASGERITSVLCADGATIFFDDNGGRLEEYRTVPKIAGTVVGKTAASTDVRISLDSILEIKAEKNEFDFGKTAGTVFGISASAALVVVLLILAAFSGFRI